MRRPRLRVRCWGTRGTCPSPGPATVRYGGNTPCVEVRSDGDTLLVLDAGSGIRALGARMQQHGDDKMVHIFLTHRHGDHVLGLPHFAPLFTREQPVCLHCGNSDADTLRPFLTALLSPPIFPHLDGLIERLDVCDWRSDGTATVGEAHAQLRVTRLDAFHPGEAAVLRVDDSEGMVLAYAPDNELAYAHDDARISAWRAGLARAISGVPLLIHDATYTDDELPLRSGWGHSSAEEATRFAMECEAGSLLLFHHLPDRTDDEIDRMVDRCRAIVQRAGSSLEVRGATETDELEL